MVEYNGCLCLAKDALKDAGIEPLQLDMKEGLALNNGVQYSTSIGIYCVGKMDVLLSNMDDDDHSLALPPTIGGFTLKTKSFDIDAGSHLLVEYKLTTSGVNKGWSVMTKQFPFLALPNGRNEVGIPEPANLTVLAVMAFAAVTPRRRRQKA